MAMTQVVRWHPNPYVLYRIVPHANRQFCIGPSDKDHQTCIQPYQGNQHSHFYVHEIPGKKNEKDIHVTFATTDGQRLKIRKGDKDNFADLILKKAKNNQNEIFALVQHPNMPGAFYIKNVHSGKALDYDQGLCQPGRRCCQLDYHGNDSQIYHIVPVEVCRAFLF